MNADYVEQIVRNLDKQSYRCILVDGVWGIGKTYLVKKALEDKKDRTCLISLFGMDDCQKIYHEALFQLVLRTSRGGKIVSSMQNIAKAAGTFCSEVANLSSALEKTVSERELFALSAAQFRTSRIIVIDDLERRKKGLALEELFGVIEDLKQSNYIKVILIANSSELDSTDKAIFEKYREKLIDRAFTITEHSTSIKWLNLGIDGDFIEDFLLRHPVKNLRTLQKAQYFFNDVKQFCTEIDDPRFLSEIQLICFAIVVESTDNLYYKEPDSPQKDQPMQNPADGLWIQMGNLFDQRLNHYLRGINSGSLIKDIYAYYDNKTALTPAKIQAGYQLYCDAGEQPNFYKSEAAIRSYLNNWQERLNDAQTSTILTFLAGDFDSWFRILEQDNAELIALYRSRLKELLAKEAGNRFQEGSQFDLYDVHSFYNITQTVQNIYCEVLQSTREDLVRQYVDYLRTNPCGKTAYQYASSLRRWYSDGSDLKKVIDSAADSLLTKNAFPLHNTSNQTYSTCQSILAILYLHNKDALFAYYDTIKEDLDKMEQHRCQIILRDLEL